MVDIFSLYALGCEQTEVSTLICESKLLRKLDAIRSRLVSIKNVIYFEDDSSDEDGFSGSLSNCTVASFSEVEKLGKENPVESNLPSKNAIAVIMYTSGSTGLPKVCFFFNYCNITGVPFCVYKLLFTFLIDACLQSALFRNMSTFVLV